MSARDPAIGLVRASCARHVGEGSWDRGVGRTLSAEDWGRAVELADRHRVLPMLVAFTRESESAAPPERIADELRTHMHTVTRHNLAVADALERSCQVLDRADVRALAYKGPVIATRLHGGLNRRQYLDLDVLVDEPVFGRAATALEAAGFEAKKRLHGLHEVVYADDRGTIVDLHASATPRYFPGSIAFDSLWGRRDTVDIGTTRVPTLGLEDLLVVLSVHGTKHCWRRLAWIVDIARLLAAEPLDWTRVAAQAQRVHGRRMVRLARAMAVDLLGIDEPDAPGIDPKAHDPIGNLVTRSREGLFTPDERPFIDRFRYHVDAMDGRLNGLQYALRLATIPSEADRNLVALPEPLAPLYSAIRPPRLLGTYLRRWLAGR